jgi:DNA (cytosine-5)-methyltransferase 1
MAPVTKPPLRTLDLFSGIGGFSYAAEKLVGGFETTAFVECEPFCQRVLAKHWPDVPIHNDVRTFQAAESSFDVITAGFPCQDLSIAGKQAGLDGARSGLFYEVIRLARDIRPKFLILENVANLVSHQNGETFQEVLYQIARAGFDAEWAVVSAQDVGACHIRKRIWIVAYACEQHLQRCWTERQSILSVPSEQRGALWSSQGVMLSPDWRSYTSEPVLRRGDARLSNRVHRLRALGNTVVPHVAAVPFSRVRQLWETMP